MQTWEYFPDFKFIPSSDLDTQLMIATNGGIAKLCHSYYYSIVTTTHKKKGRYQIYKSIQ